jgi:hypothetical protein
MPPFQQPSPYRQQSPRLMPIRTGSPAVGYDRSGALRPASPAQFSPERDPRDKRRMRHESLSRSGSPYRATPSMSSPRPGHSPQMSVPSISVSQPPRQGSSQTHTRSLSMNAGSTPLHPGKPLSPLSSTLTLGDGLGARPRLKKQSSVASSLSSNRSSYKAYDPKEALDAAYLASPAREYGPSPTYSQHRSRSGRM